MQVYLVGGAVRDELLGFPFFEKDWVVVGATPEIMQKQGYRPVGKDFPVFIHPDTGEEYALARTERKSGHGYTGFQFTFSPDTTLEMDLERRDLTINAIAKADDGSLYDPYNGQQDLVDKVLRHVSDAFTEDPLRVLRVARFAARYHHLGFSIHPTTLQMMQSLASSGELDHLTAERVWKETEKALGEQNPQVYFETLKRCGALKILFPEVEALFGVPQRKEFHPEIDTGIHTLMSLQQAARLSESKEIRFATLVHDLGKAQTPADELPKHIMHEERGVPLVQALCERLKVPTSYKQLAVLVCRYHLQCHQAFDLKPSTVLKLLQRLDSLRKPERVLQFVTACMADARGRTGLESKPYPQADYLQGAHQQISTIKAKHLVEQGLQGEALGKALEEQRVNLLTEFKAQWASEQNNAN